MYKSIKKIEGSQFDNNTLKQIEVIYKQLISNRLMNEKGKTTDTLKLLATDNTFQPTSSLYFFDVDGQLPPTNSKYFIKISEVLRDKEILFDFFDILVIQRDDLQLDVTDKIQDVELISSLQKRAKYFATLFANIKAEDSMATLDGIINKITKAKFYKVQSLSISFTNKSGRRIYNQSVDSWYDADANSMYYAGQFDNPLTLYNLSSSLSSLFEIEGKDREIALILQLSTTDIERWLNSKGYDVIEYESNLIEDFTHDDIATDQHYSADTESLIEEDSHFESSIVVDENDEDFEDDSISSEYQNQNKLNYYSREKSSEVYNTNTSYNEIQPNDKVSTSSVTLPEDFRFSSQKKRLISYVSNDSRMGGTQRIDNAGKLQCQLSTKRIAFDYEDKAGRRPIQPSGVDETYDIISHSDETEEINRYIKIYGFMGEWNNYDVILSKSQMKVAKDLGEKFWIYVIEFVDDEQCVRINRIQNPYDKITDYVLDYGWRAIAEKNNLLDKFIAGAKINHFTHGLGVIKGEINKGKLKLLIVDFASGEKRIPINITKMNIMEE